MLTYWETLIATRSNIAVNDSYAQLWGRKLSNAYTVATYTGTLPATLQTVEGYLESYKIYGNTEQDSGTPTPENPIVPSGCGERTENLFDVNANNPDNGYAYGKQVTLDGSVVTFPQADVSEYISITPFSLYTFTYGSQYNDVYAALYNAKREFVRSIRYNLKKEITFYSQENENYLRFTYRRSNGNTVMLNSGSTALPYEPYGYKLPLTVNGVEYPIYLGEVKTTRKIKKLVLTGEETWSYYSATNAPFKLNLMDGIRLPLPKSIYWVCSHYEAVSNSASWASYDSCISWSTADGSSGLRFRDIRYSNLDDFKNYIAQQYANGTPVTVWYVLVNPTTGILNEPLQKIGNYADTIDSTQSTVQIPTAAGETTISWAGEGLAPSEVELVYKAKR